MKKVIFFSAATILLAFAHTYVSAQEASVEINDQWTIGNDSSKPIEYSLGRPRDASIDSKGNIYIADQGAMTIKVFDKSGNHIKSIGQRGRGPGDFLSLRLVHVNSEDNLIVVDEMNFRISKFNHAGELIDEYAMSKKNQDIVFFSQILQLDNKNYFVLYKDFGSVENENEIFHIYSDEFDKKIKSFGSFKELGYEPDSFSEAMARIGLGSMQFVNHNTILFAPSLYKGDIYLYRKNNNNEWKLIKKLSGLEISSPAHENYGKETNIKGAKSIYTPQGKLQGNIYVSGEGIFKLKNGHIANFSMIKIRNGKEEGKWQFGVELFDSNLNFLGYHELQTLNQNPTPFLPSIKAKDNDDNFYMLRHQNGVPVVRKFSLDIQQK